MSADSSLPHAASALRTSLVGHPMLRFDAPSLVGPVPTAGRVVERVEATGRHIEIEWDNGMVLHTQLRRNGTWHVYRKGTPWRRPYHEMCASIENDEWVSVCFNAQLVETFRRPDKRRHPGMGRLGPDLTARDADLGKIVELLMSYPDPTARISDALLDQRVMVGLGNVYRCEVLWATAISPFGRVGDLHASDAIEIVNAAAKQVRTDLRLVDGARPDQPRTPVGVYGRNGQRCDRCAGSIRMMTTGQHRRLLFWCPDCQNYLEPRSAPRDDTPVMDRHPAVEQFLADLPWNRVS